MAALAIKPGLAEAQIRGWLAANEGNTGSIQAIVLELTIGGSLPMTFCGYDEAYHKIWRPRSRFISVSLVASTTKQFSYFSRRDTEASLYHILSLPFNAEIFRAIPSIVLKMEDGKPVEGSLYVYAPNKIAPVFFAVAFAASAVGHIWQCHRYKCFKMIGLHPLCAVLFFAGYVLREYGAFDYIYTGDFVTLITFILSQVFIYICPPLLELANYHVLGRILYYVPYLAPLPPGRVLSTFGGLMIVVETLNSVGVALSNIRSPDHNSQELGGQITIAALAIQLGVIIIFFVLAAIFHRRCAKANIHARAISTPLTTLYVSMALILIRCIYRLVEHFGNTTVRVGDAESLMSLSPILRYEWYFYVFEASLMLINSVIWNVWNPGRYLPMNHHVYLARDGKTELEAKVQKSGRPWLALLTLGMFFREKQEYHPFLELDDRSDANALV
ncbi:hypothetical protein V492_01844 [Pseudogymnoascus sp. VKM F-4246]|nr:hypothetical protein V492_01844 [Pseudogymnoascus sp. VKM F-4246]